MCEKKVKQANGQKSCCIVAYPSHLLYIHKVHSEELHYGFSVPNKQPDELFPKGAFLKLSSNQLVASCSQMTSLFSPYICDFDRTEVRLPEINHSGNHIQMSNNTYKKLSIPNYTIFKLTIFKHK